MRANIYNRAIGMAKDYDRIDFGEKQPDSMIDMSISCIAKMEIFMAIILFVMAIYINSDIFIDRFLGKFSGTVYANAVTSWGTIVQAIFLVVFFIIADLLLKYTFYYSQKYKTQKYKMRKSTKDKNV